jgi:hypothetical protein
MNIEQPVWKVYPLGLILEAEFRCKDINCRGRNWKGGCAQKMTIWSEGEQLRQREYTPFKHVEESKATASR